MTKVEKIKQLRELESKNLKLMEDYKNIPIGLPETDIRQMEIILLGTMNNAQMKVLLDQPTDD